CASAVSGRWLYWYFYIW
nr:immunoglobulin heavy chain junction region [Macaca mulatta]MOW75764.1 immunoglobulin heavy chain junction region [Macaca mulatta]MOW78563.1 immunoglobulin heavy chain junction region [Macaca mulatta]MOW78842.1 immunoglobulin heavy chain junction region [Macaca mulatta]MOW80328.1 immunoglobulin heavy chain junction region [Macaca mulatta]